MATLLLSAAGSALGGALGGSFAGLGAAVLGRAAGAVIGSAIHQRLVDLVNRDAKPIDENDGPLLAEVFARCEPVKAGVGKLAGTTDAERFASFVGVIKAGLARCDCNADLAAASRFRRISAETCGADSLEMYSRLPA